MNDILQKRIKEVLVIATALSLSGCAAGFGEDYSCQSVGGIKGCVTMNDIRSMGGAVNNGMAGGLSGSELSASDINNTFTILPRRNKFGHPTRTLDEVQKVTVFPFVEANGLYVDTTDLYIVLDDRHWSGRPVQSIRKD
ncbi:type IV conjugative transfer system lipoprotein TraV [Moritella viscosa]|uniref:type IV conjugative transfer system lipoprotein TraV n=1 Tax=Moritella viscosa TaxID=80854 RepID=UPI00091A82AE|nr:type IV conjugative transfer system lipoprotein TraV [Moritella viscosa]SGZ09584.1 Type IV conjugative transfer system protein TraV [Moritella viscosa]